MTTDSLDVGQLFVMGIPEPTLDARSRSILTRERLAGVILFKRNIESLEQVVELNREIVTAAPTDAPFLLSVDQEGGRVARLRGIATDIPSMRTLGKLAKDDEDLPYRVGAMMARELVSMGFHLDFAPVLDVDTNPANPVIGERAFSRDAHEVALFGSRMIQGLQQSGIAACGKHFPGHGDTDTDSHLALPRVPHSMQRLNDVELVPFRAAVDAGVASIMTAHVAFPALDAELPATLSPHVLSVLLRDRLGFDGVIISDDLEMKGVADHYSIDEMVRMGLIAGVDLFLICKDADKVEEAIAAAKRAVIDGTVPRARIASAIDRVVRMKERFIGAPAPPSLDEARRIVRAPPHLELAARLFAVDEKSARAASVVDVV
jgi:beta-N-acetylhexosaminidase